MSRGCGDLSGFRPSVARAENVIAGYSAAVLAANGAVWAVWQYGWPLSLIAAARPQLVAAELPCVAQVPGNRSALNIASWAGHIRLRGYSQQLP